jgi:hypothetical protein
VFTLSAALTAIAGFACGALGARPVVFLGWSVVVTLLSYGGVSIYAIRTIKEVEERYPTIALDDRLPSERGQGRDRTSQTPSVAVPNSSVVTALESDIDMEQNRWPYRRRPMALKQLHERTVRTFAASPGFGVARGAPNLKVDVELPRIESVPQPGTADLSAIPPESWATMPPAPGALDRARIDARSPDAFRQLHAGSLLNFVNAPGFGYVTPDRKVVGFQEHHFRKEADVHDAKGNGPWRVERVELVSLLEHAEPCVYVSDNLPRMDELRGATTRPLDGFEANRLPELLRGEDLVFSPSGESVRVLGAIRAAKQCLACHNVERGDLLGAFSYRLGRRPQ